MQDSEEFRHVAHEAIDWAAEYLDNPGRYPVTSSLGPGEFTRSLPESGPEEGEPLAALFADFERLVLPGITHWNHPRFFNYFACSGSTAGVLAEMLAATINTNGLNWLASPAVSELEQTALSWLRQWMGLDRRYFGQILDTASTGTLHALIAARQFVAPETRVGGHSHRLTVYCSDQAHSSVDKAMIAAGFGLGQLRRVPTGESFEMSISGLARMVANDLREGFKPCCAIPTVGTTSTTSVDSVAATVKVAEEYGMWVHIDAAYAGAAMLLPELQPMLERQDRAHSLVVNPHKWMFTQVDCSAFFCTRPDILRDAFSLTPEYLRTPEDPMAISLMDYGLPLGRRFRGLKLWMVLRQFGRQGLIDEIRRHIGQAQMLRAWVEADPRFEVAAPSPFSTLCFRHRDGEEKNRQIVEAVNGSHEFFISQTMLRGKFTIRVAIGNLYTQDRDVEALWARIASLG